MSDSCKIIENDDHHSNEINDEPLDPRIQIELERANAATSEINNLETQLHNAQKLFQLCFTNCKQRLATLAKKHGRCVERARPYYNICKQTEEAQLETLNAAQEYQNSVELYHSLQESLTLGENKLSTTDNLTRQEYVDHVMIKITQAEKDKIRCEQIHEEKSKLYQEYEQQRIKLYRSLTRTIMKSKIYFDEKVKAENELKENKLRIEDIQKAIIQAKKTYRTALNNLEKISEEIHLKRQTQISIKLPSREPGVGAENPDEFIELTNLELTEFPKLDLSDESSDNDLSNSMSSLSINTSTNCMHHPLSNNDIPNTVSLLTTNKCKNHFSTPTIDCVNNENNHHRGKHMMSNKTSNIKSTRMIRTNETPLLSDPFGTIKFHSDSNLNLITKQ